MENTGILQLAGKFRHYRNDWARGTHFIPMRKTDEHIFGSMADMFKTVECYITEELSLVKNDEFKAAYIGDWCTWEKDFGTTSLRFIPSGCSAKDDFGAGESYGYSAPNIRVHRNGRYRIMLFKVTKKGSIDEEYFLSWVRR